jgi:hypothetical protein
MDGTLVKVKEKEKKHNAKAAWLAKLQRMRRPHPSDDENNKGNDEDEPLILDVFGDAYHTKKFLERPEIMKVLGDSLKNRYIKAGKPPTDFVKINKEKI